MPYSLVLNLLPASPLKPGYLSGKHLHALFLTLVSSVDQELGDRLHRQTTNKAFTLSPLQRGDRHRNDHQLHWQYRYPIPENIPCWWRISLLDDKLFGKLGSLWLNLNPERSWHLGPTDLYITSILGTPQSTQPWANYCPYELLYEQASDNEREIAFAFCTPVTFRQGQYDSALPTRELVFGSLLRRWNEHSDRPFDETSLEPIFPSFFDLRTELVNDARSRLIGCVGRLTFRILGDVSPDVIRQINALADFALYAGVGRKTPMGMGMIRRLGHNN